MRTSSVSIVTLALAIALRVGGCGGTTTTVPSPAATTAASGDGSSASQQVTVSIKDFAFDPDPISVPAGGTVTWTNDDSANHRVTFDDPSVTSSDTLGHGATSSATFPKAGSYTYHCNVHPSMLGTVTVT